MLETDDIHGRAVEFKFQRLAFQHHIQTSYAMLVGSQTAVFIAVIMVMYFGCVGSNEWQQGERQGE
ncbi:hypothetical protein PSE10B_38880 [Pseudomonas amygdali pv. eriobotryae]|uniref:Uncharacterized protein n=1 Tax=Pseudomonas amygdali pv. eriobotryae TaxID=129137 RepID=A0A9P3AI49_PSEA0|nr:hypothetical protein Pta6605_08070 [Pseudomonas amygdali pv. tabaci]GFZ62429.1 hypothetical protein PSE10A_49400 [Pseudomonas amygdali pv. eriobotryae]GFZ67366.1 hypothetical protein PSE10B_38880 [Pseudomonas amygdali pv. eriobotryae]GFZ74330.1 hypothetical protein PSE10C_50720 [Pseudomonas amygdali pv. eriobotryae]